MSNRIISQNYAPLPPKHSKNLLIYPTRKISSIKFTSSVVKSVIPSPWNCNFHLITLCKLHLWLQPWLLCHFLTSAFKYICDMLIWLIDVYWMLSLGWQKHWMVKDLSSKIFILCTFQCYLENPASSYASFPLFSTSFFMSKFTNFRLTPLHFTESCPMACQLIRYNGYSKLVA